MATTRALVVTRHGGPEVLAVEEREVAEPGPGEALVEVAAGGVNFIDVYQREGIYPTEPPYVAGFEAAGTVRAVGEGAAASISAISVSSSSGSPESRPSDVRCGGTISRGSTVTPSPAFTAAWVPVRLVEVYAMRQRLPDSSSASIARFR